MRRLSKEELAWAGKLLIGSKGKTDYSIRQYLESNFFKRGLGNGLIIQTQEKYAILFLKNEYFDDSHSRNDEIQRFTRLVCFLKLLALEGFVTLFKTNDQNKSGILTIQDGFNNPEISGGRITLNKSGDYTESPSSIQNNKGNTIYKGVAFEHDLFDLIYWICNSQIIISNAFRVLLQQYRTKTNAVKPPKPGIGKKIRQSLHANKVILAFIIALLPLTILAFLHFKSLAGDLKDLKASHSTLKNHFQALASGSSSNPEYHSGIHFPPDTLHGIDVSHWNGNLVEEDNLHSDLDFVICKATQGTDYIDPEFQQNWKYLQEKAVMKGAYHFYVAGEDPELQATHFIKTTGDIQTTDLPPILDIEETSIRKGTQISSESLQNDLLHFLQKTEKLSGRKPMIYVDKYFADRYLNDVRFRSYALWLAQYTDKTPTLPGIWKDQGFTIWQKTDSYSLESQKTDFDIYLRK